MYISKNILIISSCRHNLVSEESHGAKHPPCAFKTVKINRPSNIKEMQALYVTVHGKTLSHSKFAVTGVLLFCASSRAHVCRSDSWGPPRH